MFQRNTIVVVGLGLMAMFTDQRELWLVMSGAAASGLLIAIWEEK